MTKYVIGPDVAIRLAHAQAVIGAGHHQTNAVDQLLRHRPLHARDVCTS